MKTIICSLLIILLFAACNLAGKSENYQGNKNSIEGTWRLVSAMKTEKDSTFSTFNPKTKMIKIINNSHFSFFNHDLNNGKDSTTVYFAGGGKYTLNDSLYTENLEYFSLREWENNKFDFIVKVQNDTLTQKGIEKIEKLGIDRIIIEKYVREK
jgi:hypothetical protein